MRLMITYYNMWFVEVHPISHIALKLCSWYTMMDGNETGYMVNQLMQALTLSLCHLPNLYIYPYQWGYNYH